jgi:hypothetical protein
MSTYWDEMLPMPDDSKLISSKLSPSHENNQHQEKQATGDQERCKGKKQTNR